MSSNGDDSANRSPGPTFDAYDYSTQNASPRPSTPTGCYGSGAGLSSSPDQPNWGPPYEHKKLPLDCIRLLRLRAGTNDKSQEIRAILVVVPIADIAGIEFEALSYAWGQEEAQKSILLMNGISLTHTEPVFSSIPSDQSYSTFLLDRLLYKPFSVRENLYQALRRLRSSTRDVILWVDALCINQKDDTEKTQQLSKMPLIYSHAWSVVIWIGEDADKKQQEKIAMEFIPRVLNLTLLDTLLEPRTNPDDRPGDGDSIGGAADTTQSRFGVIANTIAGWVSFAYLLQRPWFQRRWVVQEVAYARRVALRCGEHVLSWLDFADAVEILMRRLDSVMRLCRDSYRTSKRFRLQQLGITRYFVEDVLEHVQNGRALAMVQATHTVFRKTRNGDVLDRLWNLESLVTEFTSFETTDPRDMVYAYLSLANDGPLAMPYGIGQQDGNAGSNDSRSETSDGALLPQYTAQPVDVYIAFVKYCVVTTKSLDIICRHWASPLPQTDIVPSWVGLVRDSAFGTPSTSQGRINADSLVGKSKQRIYNASRNRSADASFRKPQTDNADNTAPAGEPSLKRSHEAMMDRAQFSEVNRERRLRKVKPLRFSEFLERRWLQQMASSECCLFARGLVLGRITKVSPRVVNGILASEHLSMLGWKKDTPFETFPDQLWRTLVADRDPAGRNAPMWYKRACAYAMLRVSAEGDLETSRIIAGADEQPEAIVEYCRRVQSVVWNRAVFACSDQNADEKALPSPLAATSPQSDVDAYAYLSRSPSPAFSRSAVGLGSRQMQSGDLVCILFGCSVPVVLRENRTRQHYRFVGEAYVNGKMDGEAFAGMDAHVLETKTVEFEIR